MEDAVLDLHKCNYGMTRVVLERRMIDGDAVYYVRISEGDYDIDILTKSKQAAQDLYDSIYENAAD